MKPFDVYPVYQITPVKAKDVWLWDENGTKYLDLYGGHAVISIGHTEEHYVQSITKQINHLGFYSNSILNPLQDELAEKLGVLSGLDNFSLFLTNSGAEANENALKLASFHTGKSGIIAFSKAFHGRTSAAVAATDNAKIVAPLNAGHQVTFLPLNDEEALEQALANGQNAAVIIEGIQGVGGLNEASTSFFQFLRAKCTEYGVVLILDEIQSGYGRTGKFFAYQHHNILPDLVTIAKGMGNGFPIGGVLISPDFQASHGLLGTTFGGNHLGCAAAIAVLDVIQSKNLIAHAAKMEDFFKQRMSNLQTLVSIKGRGLMLGLEFESPIANLRKQLITEHHIFTGSASNPNLLRILPPLTVTEEHFEMLAQAIESTLK